MDGLAGKAEGAVANAPGAMRLRPAMLDRAEQAVIVLMWIGLVWRVLHSINGYAPLVLISETSVMLFVLIRRPTEAISLEFGDWLLAITATAAPLAVIPVANAFPAIAPIGIALLSVGNLFQVFAKLSLRRSFGIAPANRGVKVTGLYRFVRHPIYAGYLMVHVGFLLLAASPVNLVIYTIGWWAQILRLQAEEKLLSRDPEYAAYMQRVRWRLVPGLF